MHPVRARAAAGALNQPIRSSKKKRMFYLSFKTSLLMKVETSAFEDVIFFPEYKE